ncbi:hypothetical protein B0H11DRAFT_2284430 [Mycena galericulata]|nr:hypothetical protein B0H11DRAFT_2284430 [Mycena galericulata]
MSSINTLTPAEKRKITIAAKAEKARQEQVAFELEKRTTGSGGRKAKQAANDKAVWNRDQPATRKRASSTAQVSENPKKARETQVAEENEGDESEAEPKVSSKSVGKSALKTSKKIKNKVTAAKPSKAPVPAVTKSSRAATAANLKPAGATKLVADSASEVDSEASDASGEDSDGSEGVTDVAPSAHEFLAEVPRIVGKKSQPLVSDNEVEDVEMSDVPTKRTDKSKTKITQRPVDTLFSEDSDDDQTDYIRAALKKAAALKARKAKELSEEAMPDLVSASDSDRNDLKLHEALAKALTTIPREDIAYALANPRKRRASSGSWSSGQDLSVPASDIDEVADDSVDDDNGDIDVPVKKVRKVSAARQKQADLEKPQVRPAASGRTVKGEGLPSMLAAEPANLAPRPDSSWHPSAQLVHAEPGKDLRLNSQSEECRLVVRDAIDGIKKSILLDNAFPHIISRTGFGRTLLLEAAKGPEAIHIKERLTVDPKYAALLADLLLDRINSLRGAVKKIAVNVVPGYYKIAGLNPQKIKELVDEQLQDHRYIFPSDPVTGRLKTDEPFLHPALVAVLKQGVFTGQFKAKIQHLFISTRKKSPTKVEVPDPMVALAATAIYAALVEYRLTGEHQSINFIEGAYEDTYRNHIKTLTDTRILAGYPLHKVLHRLFNEVTEAKTTQPSAGSSALLINLVDVPESD